MVKRKSLAVALIIHLSWRFGIKDGKPFSGATVMFSVTGGGSVSPTTARTDSSGRAAATLTLGSSAGVNVVKARVSGILLPQIFTATAVAPPPEPEPEPVMPEPPSTPEPSQHPPVYWIENNAIYYQPTPEKKELLYMPTNGRLTGGLAVDMEGEKIYWTEESRWTDGMKRGNGKILSANLHGTEVELFKKINAVPLDIALDTKDKNLYWTNSRARIQRINIGSGTVENVRGGLDTPKYIAFDVTERRLYWTNAAGIWSIYADNKSGIPRPLKTDLGEVRGIAVFNDVVYWTEQTNGSGRVRYMNRNGSGGKKLLASLEEIIPGGIAVDDVGEKVYWATSHGIKSELTGAQNVAIRRGEPAGIALGSASSVLLGPAAAPAISSVGSQESVLLANYPNPFNPETWIPYQLSESADVRVSIYSINGSLVRQLDLGHQSAGVYRSRSRAAYWDGRNEVGERVASGLYFYTLTAGDFTATRKMLIRK